MISILFNLSVKESILQLQLHGYADRVSAHDRWNRSSVSTGIVLHQFVYGQ